MVFGQAFESDGSTPLSNTLLTVTGSDSGGRTTVTTFAGRYVVRDVPPGPVCVLIKTDDRRSAVAAGSFGILSAGGAERIDLRRGINNAVGLPFALNGRRFANGLTLFPGDDERNDLGDQQLLLNGMPYVQSGGARLVETNSLETGPFSIAGALVERRVYAPPDADWVRYLEILQNPGATPLELLLEIKGTTVGAASITSSGGGFASAADRWVAIAGTKKHKALGFVFGGANGADAPAGVIFSDTERYFELYPEYHYNWRFTLAPGAKAVYMHFVVIGQEADAGPIVQTAASLSELTQPRALDGLSQDLRASVRNFNFEG